jgi:hypothetical protein
VTALGTLLFWATFFADLEAQRSGVLAARHQAWFAWELSFPLADAWMSAMAAVGAWGLWRRRPVGLLGALVSGGAMVFLGLIDITFFLSNGLYAPLVADTLVEAAIHVWLTGFGTVVIAMVWRHRAALWVEVVT